MVANEQTRAKTLHANIVPFFKLAAVIYLLHAGTLFVGSPNRKVYGKLTRHRIPNIAVFAVGGGCYYHIYLCPAVLQDAFDICSFSFILPATFYPRQP